MSEIIRISIGTEPMQEVATKVLCSSILRRTKQQVEFTFSWTDEYGWDKRLSDALKTHQKLSTIGTRFNIWRWLVPNVYSHNGRAIYLDSDQVVLTDIDELWNLLTPDCSFAAVCNAVGVFGPKKPTPNVIQSSVMVLDCKECNWDTTQLFTNFELGRLNHLHGPIPATQYANLMQASWWPKRIFRLNPGWNHFGICNKDTRLIHWSHVATQPYRNIDHPTVNIFKSELVETIKAGHITLDLIDDAIKRNYLHKSYRKLSRL